MSVFSIETQGAVSNRDDWVINPSVQILENALKNAHHIYHQDLANFDFNLFKAKLPKTAKPADFYKFLDTEINTEGVISWTDELKRNFVKKQRLAEIDLKYMRTITYRAFVKRVCYFNSEWIVRPREFPSLLPTKESYNVFLCVEYGTPNLSALITTTITDIGLINVHINAYPLYSDGKEQSAISSSALFKFKKHYKDESISPEDIFYFVYGILHHKGFKQAYKNFLAKEDHRVPLSKDFKKISYLGKELALLHLNYENLAISEELRIFYNDVLVSDLKEIPDEDFRVTKMELKEERLIYNEALSVGNIPKKAWEYTLCGKSAIKLYMNAQRVKVSKKAKDVNGDFIISDPNDFAGGKYVFLTLLRVISLAVKSVELIEKISTCDYQEKML
ncbi:type ISP restriction/modification enzyme [Helicobacter suis]|uniref:type ISP restriction/modification enzyme n=1 Tax=Helicobacter suis TaxID=104628 RepID=UPI0013D60DE9|nr:type ISP restriction/modification enzyme [Helicobacter suis]